MSHGEDAPTEGRVLSFVVPAFQEEDQIDAAVEEFLACGHDLIGSGTVSDFEIVVVDDGSDDATAERLAERSDGEPRLVVVSHDHNRGLGAALRSGFAASRGDVVVYIDADLPFDLSAVGRGLDLMEDADVSVVSVYRLNRRGEGARRFVYSHVYNAVPIRARFGLRVRDVNCAGKFLTREALDSLDLRSEGSFIDVEMLIQLSSHGFETEQFGVVYQPRTRGVSTASSFATIRTIFSEMRSLGPGLRAGAGRR